MQDRLKTAVRSVSAPPELRARILEQVRASASSYPSSRWSRQVLAMAATLLIAMGGVIAYQLGHLRLTTGSQESFVASVSSRVVSVMRIGLGDHIHCAVFRKFPKNPPSFQELTSNLEPEYSGFVRAVAERVPGEYRIFLAHSCRYHGRKFLHLALKSDSKLLSVVIARKEGGESFGRDKLLPALSHAGLPLYRAGAQRFQIAAFETSSHLAYIVSDLPQPKNMQIMVAVAPAIQEFLKNLEG